MYKTCNLANHPYSNCYVIHDNDGITFVSYRTPVVRIDAEGWIGVTNYVTCSATTRKQVGWFMQEYARPFTYHDCKRMLHDNAEYNLHTGEVRFY